MEQHKAIKTHVDKIDVAVIGVAEGLHTVNYAMREALNEVRIMPNEDGSASEQEAALFGAQHLLETLCGELDEASNELHELSREVMAD